MFLSLALVSAFCAVCAAVGVYAVYYTKVAEHRWRLACVNVIEAGRDELRATLKTHRAELEAMRDEHAATLKTARADLVQFAEQVEDLIDHARRQRASEDGRRGGRPRKEEAKEGPAIEWTVERYRDHVERTGKSIPEVEAALGL